MLFTALKGLFFLERRLKGTMVWFIGLSSAGRSGTFRGVTQNRAESQPQPRMGPVLRGREGPVLHWCKLASCGCGELGRGAEQRASRILQGMLRSIISQSEREPPFLEPLEALCALRAWQDAPSWCADAPAMVAVSHQLSSFWGLEA